MTNKEAIEILTNVKNTPQITWTNGADIAFDLAIKALEDRPQGHWITENIVKPYAKCNQCGEICELDNFCGNCGAYMTNKEVIEVKQWQKQ